MGGYTQNQETRAQWTYDGRFYMTMPVDWETLYRKTPDNTIPIDTLCSEPGQVKIKYRGKVYPVVYHTGWGKCFLLQDFRYSGNQMSKLTAWLMDVYNPEKSYISKCSKLCKVIEKQG